MTLKEVHVTLAVLIGGTVLFLAWEWSKGKQAAIVQYYPPEVTATNIPAAGFMPTNWKG